MTGSSHGQSPPPQTSSLSSTPMPSHTPFTISSRMNGFVLGQAIGDDVDKIAQRRIRAVRGRVDATVCLQQAEPPVALAFAGAKEEVADDVLAVELQHELLPVGGENAVVGRTGHRQPFREERVIAVDDAGRRRNPPTAGIASAITLGKTQVRARWTCGCSVDQSSLRKWTTSKPLAGMSRWSRPARRA